MIKHLLHGPRDPLAVLTPREREVLTLLAEGHSNAAIGGRLHVTDAAVVKHVSSILTKFDIPLSAATNRRVLATLTYLRASA
ncbi:hypothetical protein Adu01nite_15090 [Paractinoplanes durhamensis]|uniref:HTH luxR-type domain-containing protein n=1 Tax=Paractinoplanes durhamensis TaxID=113563 RepID=A0ABQ3YRM4_9ACTN|nr:hypothetical protein Adu01nite_15090 [Actinoplanes durhamensis]